MFVKDYHLTLRNTPEERRCHQHHARSLKSWIVKTQAILNVRLFTPFYFMQWLLVLYGVGFDSLMMIPWGVQHVGVFKVIL